MRVCLALASLACALFVATAHAQVPTQEALLDQLKEGMPDERRDAARALGDAGDDTPVPHLIDALNDEDDVVRQLAEHSLWAIWSRSGDPNIDAALQEGIHLVQTGRLDEALARFDEVVREAPAFAEGYNRRATTSYMMGQYERSIADCKEALKLNPLHFGAMSGLGYNYLKLGKLQQAIQYFEQALDINPNKPKIRPLVNELKQALSERARDSI